MENHLKSIREAKKMSQEEVAKALHISRQSISKWENNRGNPDLENLVALSKLYGVSVDELINGLSDTPNPNQIKEQKNSYDIIKMLLYLAILFASTFISFFVEPTSNTFPHAHVIVVWL